MSDLLTPEQVAQFLQDVEGWDGGPERISRTVVVPEAELEDLIARVMEAADHIDHHPAVEREGDHVTFVNWTHSAGGVTVLDFELARQINAILAGADPSA
ncbi:4a-hydroxytetrahydrobiopterin dehydratase [Bailinhaonella thermotolerans]|uniref:Putative pterin-4-alpha-carbinolamine dehydratase n=1 Tax=Bailinhaonella thermotolerans TaxID=1070861 RepID=A0A3A4BQG7_9ACTN|nr:4a-hydroxytetrahydrobiopterin dehydratase [Bailinhaonella thermotolerans]RJL33386.1 4a-hydroxytetrahydrobiopterin dehydratase [Bailinhaonella thermotolerans]